MSAEKFSHLFGNKTHHNIGGTGMLRIGRMPIAVPAGVTVDIAENNKVTVKGPK